MIVKLTESAKNFASGNLNERIELNTRDEINDLAITFNSMANDIHSLITGLEQRVAERTSDLELRSDELETPT